MIPYRSLYLERSKNDILSFNGLLLDEERKVRKLAVALQKWEYPRTSLHHPGSSRVEIAFFLLVAGVIAASFAYFLNYPAVGFCLLVFLAIFYFYKVRDHCIALVDFQLLLVDKIKEIERDHYRMQFRLMFAETKLEVDWHADADLSWRGHGTEWCDAEWDDLAGNFLQRGTTFGGR